LVGTAQRGRSERRPNHAVSRSRFLPQAKEGKRDSLNHGAKDRRRDEGDREQEKNTDDDFHGGVPIWAQS
jgi:hypothetical protein